MDRRTCIAAIVAPSFTGIVVAALLVACQAKTAAPAADERPSNDDRSSATPESRADPEEEDEDELPGGKDAGQSNEAGGEDNVAGANPGKIACEAVACQTGGTGNATSVCCSRASGGSVCQTLGETCSGGTRFACDEDADCPGQQCCLAFAQAGGPRAVCQAACTTEQLRVCKTDDQCGAGGTCRDVTCGPRTYRSCNVPSFCQAR